MRTFRRLRLRCFSFNIYSDVLSTPLLFALSKPGHPHQKHTTLFFVEVPETSRNVFMVEMEGIEPSSRTLFSLLHTTIS